MSLLLPGTAAAVERNLTPVPERELPRDPVAWMREELDEHPWSKQREIARSVIGHRRTAVPSAHGTGKSYIASRIAAWWIAAHPLGDAFVVTSAPTGNQVKAILWRELAKAHRKASLPGRITGLSGTGPVEWYIGEELVALGRKPQDLSDMDAARQAFQGIHARYVLVVLDEATGVPEWLWQAASSLLTNEAARILAIGNPDDAATRFGEVCQPGSGWNVLPVSAFDTPAFTEERVPEVVLEGLVSRTWVEEAERDFGGKDNPLYQSKVLGLFPDTSDDRVISPAMIRKAHALDLPGSGRGAFGLDVARFGSDETCLYRVRDGVVRFVKSWRKQSTAETRKRVMGETHATPAVPVVIDVDGIGGGVHDEMVEHGKTNVVPFSVNSPARKPRRYDGRRSEVWWEFRLAVDRGEIDLDPDDLKLAAQLQHPRWNLDARGRIHVETKKELAKRGIPSPDRADAALMAALNEPIDLTDRDPLETIRRKIERSKDSARAATRLQRGEVERIRSRPM